MDYLLVERVSVVHRGVRGVDHQFFARAPGRAHRYGELVRFGEQFAVAFAKPYAFDGQQGFM